MITNLFKVQVSFKESEVNFRSMEYELIASKATRLSGNHGTEYNYDADTITEWAVFDNEEDAKHCEKVFLTLTSTKD